ncbi:LacI family DNA-binding transcriptional regulator [Herbiconiux moechotypicola]|uniref:LacI family DNA-binding transcriptional regulator n=1 Tax=Herbiconiux moechotypicola TaxID=637393 RepID=A0ABN3DCA8_9MICO
MRDVAALAGVSVGTVSNVLTGTKRVSPATERRVLDAIESLGFVRNDAARQLRVGHSSTVGFIVLDVANPFFTDVASGAEEELAPARRPLLLADGRESAERQLSYLELFEEQRVSGLLITPVGDLRARLERVRSRGIPVVLVDHHDDAWPFPSVSVDDRRGGELAMGHLLDTGSRRPAYLSGPSAIPQMHARWQGAQAAAAARGVAAPLLLELDSTNAAAGRAGARRLLDLPAASRPDAVFAANDLIALGVLQALTLAGVRVPDDIALVGYDDIAFAETAAIPLTSVRQPAAEMGRAAAGLLLGALDGSTPDADDTQPAAGATATEAAPPRIRFDPELIARASTAR